MERGHTRPGIIYTAGESRSCPVDLNLSIRPLRRASYAFKTRYTTCTPAVPPFTPLDCATANCTRLYPCRFRRIPLSREKYLMFGKNRTMDARFVIGANPLHGTGFPVPSASLHSAFLSALRSAPVSVFGTFQLCTCGSFSKKCFFFFFRRPSTTSLLLWTS